MELFKIIKSGLDNLAREGYPRDRMRIQFNKFFEEGIYAEIAGHGVDVLPGTKKEGNKKEILGVEYEVVEVVTRYPYILISNKF